ncbi:MAG: CotH kinase family protein [Muribaculaceae bacterium]|nr:CotH kinase family protein [Muribaculaceae bacterium]
MKNLIKEIGFLLTIVALFSCNNDMEASLPPSRSEIPISGTLPVLYIETEGYKPIVSKEEYLNATYYLDAMGAEDVEPLGSESEPLTMQIRGRGHSSWNSPKKPYKLKLSSKISMMGMAKNKHWALLKPSENTVAGLQLGKLMNMAWTPDFRPVEVVLNGDYIGLYFLTETIRIDKNRVNIFEQQDGETNPELINGGWLVEVDNYQDNCQITIPENDSWKLTLKYHSPENLSNVQLQWLTNEFKAINAAIYSNDKTSTDWEEYIDVESMARFFIVQEVMDNPDGFHGSFYLYKDLQEDSKWVAGPIWDLVCYFREKTDYTFKMKVHYRFTPHWIGEIIQYDSFCQAVAEVWEEVYPSQLSELYDFIDATVLPLSEAWSKDCKRWNDDPTQTAELRAERIKKALEGNIDWLNKHLPESPFTSLKSVTSTESDGPVKIYNLQGMLIGEFNNQEEAIPELKTGMYIINEKKIKVQ